MTIPRQQQQHPCRFGSLHLILLYLVAFSNSFQTPISLSRTSSSSSSSSFISTKPSSSSSSSSSSSVVLFDSRQQENENENENEIWEPKLRQIMGGIASLGVLETGYLTYNKLFQQQMDVQLPFCGVDGHGCSDILNGPYSYVPFTDIPLSAMGFLAYCSVAGLSLIPLVSSSSSSENTNGSADTDDVDDDTSNRVALIALTTTMGTFSVFLMTLLFGILQTNCPYCVFSAFCSISLAMLAWIGGCLPDGNKSGIRLATTGFLTSTVTAVLLFVSSAISNIDSVDTSGGVSWGGGTLLASTAAGTTNTQTKQLLSPPPVTTESSREAIELATTLQGMNAKMYGAYWCSHCYDQKEVFGKQAFSKIEYVECSKDGVNSKTKLCKAMDVPGYPTWEIQGKLYPGQQELDELQDLVKSITKGI